MKIVIIGAGSSYTPEFINGLILRYEEMPIDELWLVDIEDGKEKLQIICDFAKRMWKAAGYNVKVYSTVNRREALVNADYVVSQFRVGKMYARIKDERIPLLHNMLGQETNGAGELFNAFRTIPVIKEIVDDMKELCADAWLINFTNPSGIITETIINRFGWEKCIGLCNVPTIAMMCESKKLDRNDLVHRFAGINHFHWHKVWDSQGNELTSKVIDFINDKDGGTPVNIYGAPFDLELLHSINLVPCGYHRYYYQSEQMIEHALKEFDGKETRAEQVKEVEENLFSIYADKSVNTIPELLMKRGGAYYSDTACECINAIVNNKNIHMVVNTKNKGAISNIDDDSVVEVSCMINAKGAEPLDCNILNETAFGYLKLMKAMELCTIDAAINGDYGKALEAFMINPLIKNGADEKRLLDEMLVAHEKYLPQFQKKIEKLKAENIYCDDAVVKALSESGK